MKYPRAGKIIIEGGGHLVVIMAFGEGEGWRDAILNW
jgi:hypothetical protein